MIPKIGMALMMIGLFGLGFGIGGIVGNADCIRILKQRAITCELAGYNKTTGTIEYYDNDIKYIITGKR